MELDFYSREEIAEIAGIVNLKDSHFAEKVRRYLDNRGYEYAYSPKGVTITQIPQTAEERLQCLLVDALALDKQINAYDFACFIAAFSAIDGFDSMPWDSRAAFFNQYYGNDVSAATLGRWMKRLVESGNAERFRRGALWRTIKDETGSKVQVRVDANSDEYRAYCDQRSALLTGFDKADKQGRKQIWGEMVYINCTP